MRHKRDIVCNGKGLSNEINNWAFSPLPSPPRPPPIPTIVFVFPHIYRRRQSGCIANFRCSVAESSPRRRRQRWNSRRSIGYCSRLARCWPETSALTVRATSRCLCTLINGSRCIDGGSGGRASNTSGCAGGEKLPDTGSMLTNSVGAVGSIRSGRRETRCNGAR